MISIKRVLACLILGLAAASPAHAGEIFGGLYFHDVKTFVTPDSGNERGVDVHLGWRGDPLTSWKLQPHAFVSANTAGRTHYAAVGISRKFGSKVYIRPGLGVAVHTGSTRKFLIPGNNHVEFGSRVLFGPELAVGTQVNDRISIEASWVHLSHAMLAGSQNPGIDNLGVRLNYRFK